ncbi:MAG: signal peptidase II, partial [Prochloraceae cyanobacterium]|nr:signal peptidase II [Prochloraceae cyanobacterium]
LDFTLINFPVFNVADICINVGIVFLLIATFSPSVASKKIKK